MECTSVRVCVWGGGLAHTCIVNPVLSSLQNYTGLENKLAKTSKTSATIFTPRRHGQIISISWQLVVGNLLFQGGLHS